MTHPVSESMYIGGDIENSLGKEGKSSGRDNAVVPRIRPITRIPWCPCTYVGYDARSKVSKVKKLYGSCSSCLRCGSRDMRLRRLLNAGQGVLSEITGHDKLQWLVFAKKRSR
jgi:hypothetical protein